MGIPKYTEAKIKYVEIQMSDYLPVKEWGLEASVLDDEIQQWRSKQFHGRFAVRDACEWIEQQMQLQVMA